MRKAISIVLAALLVLLPVEQVLAQAVQQEAVSVQRSVSPDGAAHLFRVPPLTENSARLLRTSSNDALLESSFSNPPPVSGWNDWSDKKRALVVVGAIVAAAIAFTVFLGLLTRCGEETPTHRCFDTGT